MRQFVRQLGPSPRAGKGFSAADLFRLYKLIWERFIASQMEAAVYDTMAVDIEAGEYIFLSLMDHEFHLRVFWFCMRKVKDEDNEEEKESMLPELSEGEKVKPVEIKPSQHFTQPPPRYTEATLVKTLEEKGIGRPSTYAPTISTIISRGMWLKTRSYCSQQSLEKL